MDDSDLIASAQRGNRQAFTELVCRHQDSIVSLTYRMCGDLRLAEDAATTGFSLGYVRPKLIISGDAAATVGNIVAFD